LRSASFGPPSSATRPGCSLAKLIYAELARGHAKSFYGATYAVAEAVSFASTDVVIAAGDTDQARIVTDHVSGFLDRNPALASSFRRHGDTWEVPARGSRVRVVSSDVATSWGLGGTHRRFRLVLDELTSWPAKGEELYGALISATGKVPDVQTVILSNAGFDQGRSWQWRVREAAEREPWGYLYSPPGVIASWISQRWLEQMRALLPIAVYDRVCLNRWTSSVGDFLTRDQLEACFDPGWSRQVQSEVGRSYFGGCDLGLVKDRTALAIVFVDGADNVRLADLRVWQGSKTEEVEIASVEAALEDCASRFRPFKAWLETYQMKSSLQRLKGAGLGVEEFVPSQSSMAKISKTLYSLIASGRLKLYEDEELRRELEGIRVVQTPAGWRIDHGPGAYSDRVVALAMAVSLALERRETGHVSVWCYMCERMGLGGHWASGTEDSRPCFTDAADTKYIDKDTGSPPPGWASLTRKGR
jgi:phage terminase large subunit-like protein